MSASGRSKRWWLLGLAVLILSLGYVWYSSRRPVSTTNTDVVTTNPQREKYAALYEAAWRQDSGEGNTFVTATLMVPPLTDALGQDTTRSDAEDRLYRAAHDLQSNQVAVLMTFDSVAGPLADTTITDSLTVSADPAVTVTGVTWHPLISTPRLINAPVGTSSQIGLAVFSLDAPLSWNAVQSMHVTARPFGESENHQFSWSNVPLLLTVH